MSHTESPTDPPHPAGDPPQDRPEHDPADWTPVVERAFFERLGRLAGTSTAQGGPPPVDERVRRRLVEVEARVQPLVANALDAANARFTALAVAAYDVLLPERGSAGAAAVVDDCLNRPLRAEVLAGTRALLDGAADPFAALVAASRERERSYFGPSFRFARPVDDGDTYLLDVRRCLFHEFLVAAGRPELQPVLCRFDLNWADAVDPPRHRLRFVRPVTFAGGTTCRMLFSREEHLPGPVVEPVAAGDPPPRATG